MVAVPIRPLRGQPAGRHRTGHAGTAAETPDQAPCRQGLRRCCLPTAAAPSGITPRIARRGLESQHPAGPPSLEGGAIAGLAAGQPAPDGPLRAPCRHPHGVPASSLRADLRPQAHTVVKHLSSHGQPGHGRKAATSFLLRPALSGMPGEAAARNVAAGRPTGSTQRAPSPSARPTGPASGGEKVPLQGHACKLRGPAHPG
jgi:hypothetical protein